MERKIYADLLKWKKDPNRKPLLIYGNKQIGKTYTAVEFGEREYKTVSYINSDNNLELLKIMQKERTIDKIIAKLSLLTGESILKNDTLIIIDNVIDDDIVKAVKKFGKEPNDYHIIMITSLKEKLLTFKGEELQYKYMFPMDFEEYLRAVGNIELIDFIKSSYRSNKPMPFHNIAMDYYEEFLITGGLPESIEANIRKETDLKIRLIHEKQLDTYKKEFLYLKTKENNMRRVDLMSKTTTLVTMLSIVYALIDMKIIFLAPILTISIPYRFMKYKEEGKHTENRKILNNLFLFNLIVFIGVIAITNRMSTDIIEIIVNIIITFIYFKVLSMIDKKRETLYNNPQMVYDKINEKINALEMMYEQTEEGMRNAETEKARNSMEAKLNAIRYKIDELKRQSELIKAQIESKNNNKNMN